MPTDLALFPFSSGKSENKELTGQMPCKSFNNLRAWGRNPEVGSGFHPAGVHEETHAVGLPRLHGLPANAPGGLFVHL